jgi:ribosomal protein S6
MDKEQQKSYEISILARSEDGAGLVAQRLQGLGAEIISEESAGLINLAYPIKKQGTAHLSYIKFRTEAENIKLLKEALKFEDKILRHLIVASNLSKNIQAAPRQREAVEEKKYVSEQPVERVGLSNEDLEVKLQEISKSLPE